ncbi:hypothetical protein AGABI2DRAFT_195386 [Agaricus bisporus var. bisporus H97]|uniref:hypothetical protein n=1 Tax=Agaricus bisporus var. bisporus (strain H97 / ATCC MYA-4626 / FGSC 10389) TaxID=936046 RepID=UPI00029F591B|nr:hypothetical protein AGABI2DRAFT_195386 [Agaricus bisporus var. bisporus H97]EKV43161.1 hypothetical protein AGABI2DRAFT_195386 [Agaricus bisporus var. bisporus H97]
MVTTGPKPLACQIKTQPTLQQHGGYPSVIAFLQPVAGSRKSILAVRLILKADEAPRIAV